MIDTFDPELYFTANSDENCLRVIEVTADNFEDISNRLNDIQKKALERHSFKTDKDNYIHFFDGDGSTFVLFASEKEDIESQCEGLFSYLKSLLAKVSTVKIELAENTKIDFDLLAYYWVAHHYSFDYYKQKPHELPKLVYENISQDVCFKLRALFLGRNAINTTSEDLTPLALQEILESFAREFNGICTAYIGSDLQEKGFNLIHAVGRGIIDRERQPRLIDFKYYHSEPLWRNSEKRPTITLVGKGVCFDTGGMNLKTGNSMLLMKKDMGGAATVLAVALYLLLNKPDYNLRVLIPAVENNVTANSFRPGDIFKAYNGKTVEITNTDAEGRLILADAMSFALEEETDILIDIATLTGAARVALGPDLPAYYTNNEGTATGLNVASQKYNDPIWRLPLWEPYAKAMEGKISDLINSEAGGMAGSIKAAMFLKNFIGECKNWVHFDSYCYVPSEKFARPAGGDVMPFLTLIDFINQFVGLEK